MTGSPNPTRRKSIFTLTRFGQCLRPRLVAPLCLLSVLGLLLNTKLLTTVQNEVAPEIISPLREETTLPGECKPRTDVVFLKTHKCASSSIQNLLLRFGDARNLTFVLPSKGNYLGHPTPFSRQMVPDPSRFRLSYNILTHHARFHEYEMKRLMPNGTVFVTIVRDPVDLFESMYSYYALDKFYKMSLDRLTQAPDAFLRKLLRKRMQRKIGRNQMAFDLGLDPDDFENETAVKAFVGRLDQVFDLVMVAERIEESLVLLRDLMCWDVDDMVVFRHNARKSEFKKKISPTADARLRAVNAADQYLYEYFRYRFQQRVDTFGSERMSRNIDLVRNMTQYWYDSCVQGEASMTNLLPKKYHANSKVMAFKPKKSGPVLTCARLLEQELVYTDKLRAKQRYMFPNQPTRPAVVGRRYYPRAKTVGRRAEPPKPPTVGRRAEPPKPPTVAKPKHITSTPLTNETHRAP